MNFLSFCLPYFWRIFLDILVESSVEFSSHCFLLSKVSAEKSADSHIEDKSLLTASKTWFLTFVSCVLMWVSWVYYYWSFWDLEIHVFYQIGKFLTIVSSTNLSLSLFLWGLPCVPQVFLGSGHWFFCLFRSAVESLLWFSFQLYFSAPEFFWFLSVIFISAHIISIICFSYLCFLLVFGA